MLPVVHAAVGGWSRLLGPGLLLILNDKLVGRIHLANVDLPTDYAQVSFGFIHQGLNFYGILHILVFSEGISYPPDGVSSVVVGAEALALPQHRAVQVQHLRAAGRRHLARSTQGVLSAEAPSLNSTRETAPPREARAGRGRGAARRARPTPRLRGARAQARPG